MSIQIRTIPNDDIVALAALLDGLHIQMSSTDISGRLVSGNFQSAKAMADGRIGIKLTRYLNGQHVLDSVAVPTGTDPLGRPWRTAFHVREDTALFAALEAAA
ncbi:hypothetical protein [Pseudarthrobacter sp. PH31-O2]|uniref:hypothetical protein n=1 Tax=Pseudarthrobacter sp. PH31-O2 TaxID=3046206 RepID=UPI0024B9D448|nr:hypothetical protein [Pseudarthrobacter sp. PH31-O2]MDJ0354471.1 hypothetical protein [Pseudarthrobacter sp. PH31-O2]